MSTAALLALVVSAAPLKVGVTLHPYYAWVANVTKGTPVQVVPVLPGDVDAGAYQPRPDDVLKLADLDALVINGLGHDEFILGMVKASGNSRCVVLRPNNGAPVLKSAHGGAVNSHTFLSFSNAIQQTYLVARELGALWPAHAKAFQANAAAYVKRLKAQRAAALKRLAKVSSRRVVTVHEGYSYLLQELGIELVDVVEPAHGLVPSATELTATVAKLKGSGVTVVLSEAEFPAGLRDVLTEAGATVTVVSHIATGEYSAERFEVEMQRNVDAIATALGG
ncbi:MAG: zinc ABC transporter substrate-binding protein [Archangium sp.]|nr:zinc ABC transporter substrate-binding protein [Archangium sp.]